MFKIAISGRKKKKEKERNEGKYAAKGTYNINRYIDIIVVCDKIQSEFSAKIKVFKCLPQ